MQMEMKDNFVCVECGRKAKSIFKRYENGITKLSRCVYCGHLVDEYTELDGVLVFLNLLLHKIQAFRHLIYNRTFTNHKKWLFLYMLTDIYSKWCFISKWRCKEKEQSEMEKWNDFMTNYFLMLTIVTLCEYITQTIVALCLIKSIAVKNGYHNLSMEKIVQVLIISQYGRLFNMAVAIWSSDDYLFFMLAQCLIFTTSVQSFRVLLSRSSMLVSMVTSVISLATSFLVAMVAQYHFISL
ncbi:protein ARV1-like [Clytia hemisphaerica]|uniref:Protein ARV n=1 Tax=Clytia hemisphaerica TaxID=252671 RepID=A0A7M5V4C6_9CNID